MEEKQRFVRKKLKKGEYKILNPPPAQIKKTECDCFDVLSSERIFSSSLVFDYGLWFEETREN